MKNRQISKLAMYHAVQAFLNKTETDALPRLGAKRAAFITLLSNIDRLSAKQAQPTFGLVLDRDSAFGEVAKAALAVAGLARSYAEGARLGDLAARLRLRPSRFTGSRLPQRLQLAQRIYDEVLPHAAALAGEGVTAAMLADLKAKLDAAAQFAASPRATQVEKQDATRGLFLVFREMDQFLESQLDPMMDGLRVIDPGGYREYRLARAVINRSATRKTAADPLKNPPAALQQAA